MEKAEKANKANKANKAIEVQHLSVAYRKNRVLDGVSFTIAPGTMTAIVGPNGAGKSTLIKAMLDLTPRLSGEIRLFGEPYRAVKARIGYVPQRGSVDWDFPTDALDVAMMGLYGRIGWFRRPGKQHRERALAALAQMGMADFARRQISELSGGQQQRVFLARALVQEADLYVLDEPLAGVDAATERIIMETLNKIKEQGRTVLVVHHDLTTVEAYFDHVLLLNGRVVAHGQTEDVFTGENLAATYGGALRWLAERSG